MVSSAAGSEVTVMGAVGEAFIPGSIGAAEEAAADGAGADGSVFVPVVPQALIPMMVAAEIRAKVRRWYVLFVVMGFLFMELAKGC